MSKKESGPSLFDEDFEVTYEEEPINIINIDNDIDNDINTQSKKKSTKNTQKKPDNTKSKKCIVPKTENIPVLKKKSKKSAPKAYGNRHIYNTSFYIIRTASIILAVSIVMILMIDFIRGAAPYGDITTISALDNFQLLSYLIISAIILLFYSIMLLFSFKREVIVKKGRKYKLDMGNGIGTYISLYLMSYISFIICAIIPDKLDTLGFDFIDGVLGALDVFGSMHNLLLGMCTAGVIACIARKNMN